MLQEVVSKCLSLRCNFIVFLFLGLVGLDLRIWKGDGLLELIAALFEKILDCQRVFNYRPERALESILLEHFPDEISLLHCHLGELLRLIR